MSASASPAEPAILVVRLGAMGDILHALPAARALKLGHPHSPLVWAVEPKWAPLLADNPFLDGILPIDRASLGALAAGYRALRARPYALAVDFQGLLKSALVAAAAAPRRIFGFDAGLVRERAAALFYHSRVASSAAHVVDRNLDLARAAGGECTSAPEFPLPAGQAEGALPEGDFVLASPLAGWASKQWPVEHYRGLAERLAESGVPLILNGPPGADFGAVSPAVVHDSGLNGLIYATRRAAAVVGVDSGPLHLAAALAKPGVAIFGPTDPARNGPYGGSLQVLRAPSAVTTYKRGAVIDESMRKVSPAEVFEALAAALAARRVRPALAGPATEGHAE